jgi:predicted dehydrogenase
VSTQKLRWAVVGTGDISHAIVPDLQRVDGNQVSAVASRSTSRAEEFAARHGIACSYSFEDMLADQDIDIVYIGTPHGTHADLAKQSLKAGKHVVIEKPMGLNNQEVAEVFDIGRQEGKFVMEAFWVKFSPAFQKLQQVIDSGAIGQVRNVQASFGIAFPRGSGSRWKPELGGSALLDQGIYTVALARMILGEPTTITTRGTVEDNGIDATEFVTFEYEDGRFAQLSSSMVDFIDPSASIGGTEGWISLAAPFWATREFKVYNGDIMTALFEPQSHPFEPEGFGYTPMFRAVAEAIGSGATEHPLHTGTDTLKTFALLDTIKAQLLGAAAAPQRKDHQ